MKFRLITVLPPHPWCAGHVFESRLDPFVRRHEKLKGPKGLSQKVRDITVIHNQASLRPCMWHVTAWNHTRLMYWGECAVLYTKTRHATLFLLAWPKWLPDYLIQVLHYYIHYYSCLCTWIQVSQLGFFTLMYPAASTLTRKSGFMLLVKQSANCLPVSIHSISCWVVLLGCLLSMDPQSLSQCPKLNTQTLVLHLTCNFT